MKSLIIFKSMHHGNTEKVARAMASVLNAELKPLEEAKPKEILNYGLVGFGSGVYGSNTHKELFRFVEGLPPANGKKAFVFSTSGSGKPENNARLEEMLAGKGFSVVGGFASKGLITWGPFKLFGGGNKGRPNQGDLENARKFAAGLAKPL